jgi:peptidoglycan/LPS O-acetylase OafA/YrhL
MWIARPAKVFAGFSYTLYVTHFPFLAFTTSLVTNNIRVEPSLHGLITFVSLFTLVLVYAFLVSLAFERNTPAIQRAVLRSLSTIRLPGRASQIALRPE